MAKFAGWIGFEIYSETAPDVYEPTIVEQFYRGNVEQEVRRLYPSDQTINRDAQIDNRIKIVADPWASTNYLQMKFVEYKGTCWLVKTVDVRNYPSMLIYLGGVYNGKRGTKRQAQANETN